jgi:hypothetical protein
LCSEKILFSVEKVPFALQNGPIMPEESLICTQKKAHLTPEKVLLMLRKLLNYSGECLYLHTKNCLFNPGESPIYTHREANLALEKVPYAPKATLI